MTASVLLCISMTPHRKVLINKYIVNYGNLLYIKTHIIFYNKMGKIQEKCAYFVVIRIPRHNMAGCGLFYTFSHDHKPFGVLFVVAGG